MSQNIFLDPVVNSVTPDAGNVGDGTLAVTRVTHYTITQIYTVTCIQVVPVATFAVVGSLDGSVGLATAGVEFTDQDLKISMLITEGAIDFEVNDSFVVDVAQGTDLCELNINTYDELPQKNFSEFNDDNLRYDDTTKEFSFNADEVTDAGNFFEGNALVRARDFLTHGQATYPHVVLSSQKETSDETLARKIFKITPNSPEDTAVNIANGQVTRADGTVMGITDKEGQLISFSGGTIDFATGTGTNTVTFSPATLLANEYVVYAIVLNNTKPIRELEIYAGTPDASLVTATSSDNLPVVPQDFLSIGYVIVQDNGAGGSGNVNTVSADEIIQFVMSNASPAEGDGLIQDILTLNFAAVIDEKLQDQQAIDTGATTASFVNSTFQMQYDNKIITVVANNVTIGSAPAFTAVVGDVFVQGNSVAVITNVNSQTDFDVDDGSVLTSAANATISQKVQTVNIPEFGDAAEFERSRDYLTTNIERTLIIYNDDVYKNTGVPVEVGVSASSDGSFYTDVYTRPEDLLDQQESIQISTAGNDLYFRFFSVLTSGSGTVVLNSYRAYYHDRNAFAQIVGTDFTSQSEFIARTMNNNSGSLIDQYRVVRSDTLGSNGIALADKSSIATGLGIGVTSAAISDSNSGTIVTSGYIADANLVLGFSEGTELFLDNNGVITDVAPSTAGEYILKVGEILGNDLIVAIERRGSL